VRQNVRNSWLPGQAANYSCCFEQPTSQGWKSRVKSPSFVYKGVGTKLNCHIQNS
jgi:hypothetical protein